jgi:hypothetical protein
MNTLHEGDKIDDDGDDNVNNMIMLMLMMMIREKFGSQKAMP